MSQSCINQSMPLDISSGTSSTPVSCPPTHQQHGESHIPFSIWHSRAFQECSELCNCKTLEISCKFRWTESDYIIKKSCQWLEKFSLYYLSGVLRPAPAWRKRFRKPNKPVPGRQHRRKLNSDLSKWTELVFMSTRPVKPYKPAGVWGRQQKRKKVLRNRKNERENLSIWDGWISFDSRIWDLGWGGWVFRGVVLAGKTVCVR